MRVLHIIPSLAPRRGGPSAAIIEMVRASRRLGVDAEIATTDEDMEPAAHESLLEHGSVPVRFFPRQGSWPLPLHEFCFSPAFAAWLAQHLTDYDLLHVHAIFSHLPTTAMRLARRAGVPYLNRPLGMLGRWPLQQRAWRKRAYLQAVERANLRHAAALHFVSTAEQAEAANLHLPVREIVVPHGVFVPPLLPDAGRLLREKYDLPANHKIVLFLGRLHAKKGVDLLLQALAQFPNSQPILLIAGDGPERSALEKMAKALHVGAAVRWLGFISGHEKNLCLQGADLFTLTSHHENFGLAVLEALAAGTPVVVSSQVALSTMMENAALGSVTTLQPAAIRHALAQSLAHPVTEADRQARRETVESAFSWSANARALTCLYRDLAQKSR